MGVFVRAVVTGFGFSLGAALYRRISKELGLNDTVPAPPPGAATATSAVPRDGGRAEPLFAS